jgi:hypothetical protein
MENVDSNPLEVPQADKADAAHLIATTIIGLIPFAGGVDLFKFMLAPSIEKRRDKWMHHVAGILQDLQAQQGLTIEALRNNEEFATLLLQTTQAAYRTHLDEKHRLLSIGLKNSAVLAIGFDVKQLYLNLIDRFSPAHIEILSSIEYWKEHSLNCNSGNAFHSKLVEISDPVVLSIDAGGIFFLAIMEELHQAGLIVVSADFIVTDGDVHQVSSRIVAGAGKDKLPKINLTDFGRSFLQFIHFQ